MTNLEQLIILHNEIREKAKEHQKLVGILQYDPPSDPAELFRLKRSIVTLSREKTYLIQQSKYLDS